MIIQFLSKLNPLPLHDAWLAEQISDEGLAKYFTLEIWNMRFHKRFRVSVENNRYFPFESAAKLS